MGIERLKSKIEEQQMVYHALKAGDTGTVCFYLCQYMEYRDVMGSLVDEWKKDITRWNDSNRRTLIDFNAFLGRNEENESLYLEQLEESLSAEDRRVKEM